jgi:protein-tyrosine phosphatase
MNPPPLLAPVPAASALRAAPTVPAATGTRTSLSHPLRIDELPAGPGDGRIGICLCPGKRASSQTGPRWERDLQLDLETLRRWRADAVLTLIEDHEFAALGVPELGAGVRSRGIEWHHLPVVDLRAPDSRLEAGWLASGPRLLALLRQGGRVVVHCRGGLGRAGTAAARLLVELGVPPRDAIERVRAARPGALESDAQVNYVLDLLRRPYRPAAELRPYEGSGAPAAGGRGPARPSGCG